jgi:hypothetical protein
MVLGKLLHRRWARSIGPDGVSDEFVKCHEHDVDDHDGKANQGQRED